MLRLRLPILILTRLQKNDISEEAMENKETPRAWILGTGAESLQYSQTGNLYMRCPVLFPYECCNLLLWLIFVSTELKEHRDIQTIDSQSLT